MCRSVLTPAISCTKFKIHLAHADRNMAETIFFQFVLGRSSLCLTDPETQEENVLGRPTPLWISSYTSYLLYKAQDPFSACRQCHGQNFRFQFFRGDQSLPHRPRNSGRECVGQFLHQLSLVQSLRSIQRMQTVSWPKLSFSIFWRGPVFTSQIKKLRKRMCLVDQLPCGSVLTPAISSTKFKIHSVHADSPLAKTFFSP